MNNSAMDDSRSLQMQFPVSSGQMHRNKEKHWNHKYSKREREHHFGFGYHNNNNGNPAVTEVVQPMHVPIAYPVHRMMVPPSLGSTYLPQHHQVPPLSGSGQFIAYPPSFPRHQICRNNNIVYGNHLELANRDYSESNTDVTDSITQQLAALNGIYCNDDKDQMSTAAPIQSSMGMSMLQKMGWRPGEGLGKNKEGTLEPLRLHVKKDKKGLVSSDEIRHKNIPSHDVAKNFYEGKHPVSLLNEVCLRHRYGPPVFTCCFGEGPDHKKNYVFKVVVKGVEYKPEVPSSNKKQAKVDAATLCLKKLCLIE